MTVKSCIIIFFPVFTNRSAVLMLFSYWLQVYGEGTGFECRQHVQRLNLLRGNFDEQALSSSGDGDRVKCESDSVASADADNPQNHVMNYI